jgi:hypothetical protein
MDIENVEVENPTANVEVTATFSIFSSFRVPLSLSCITREMLVALVAVFSTLILGTGLAIILRPDANPVEPPGGVLLPTEVPTEAPSEAEILSVAPSTYEAPYATPSELVAKPQDECNYGPDNDCWNCDSTGACCDDYNNCWYCLDNGLCCYLNIAACFFYDASDVQWTCYASSETCCHICENINLELACINDYCV